jgi:cytochrome b pre-mRNA-processing protein 3
MLSFLFRGLTAEPAGGGAELFAALTGEARQPHWYLEGAVPDTLDGRFAVLATVTALALVRLEGDGDAGARTSVALTERFIAVMESEHRELGLGDPTLGRTVRKLVGMLARRTELWRATRAGPTSWSEATSESLYKESPSADALAHSAGALSELLNRLDATSLADLDEGMIG